jgi:hypothetical protein
MESFILTPTPSALKRHSPSGRGRKDVASGVLCSHTPHPATRYRSWLSLSRKGRGQNKEGAASGAPTRGCQGVRGEERPGERIEENVNPLSPLQRRPLHKSSNCHCEGVKDDRSNLISLIALGRDCFASLAMTRCDSYAKLSLQRGTATQLRGGLIKPHRRGYAPPPLVRETFA